MTTEGHWMMIILATAAIAFLLGAGIQAWWDDSPTGEIGTALAIERELHCQEDEDIVVTLGTNGLPYALCMQAIER